MSTLDGRLCTTFPLSRFEFFESEYRCDLIGNLRKNFGRAHFFEQHVFDMNVPVLNGIKFPTDLIIKAKVKLKQFVIQSSDYIMGQVKSQMSNASSAQPAPPAVPASTTISNKLALGAGCYWGTEKYVRKDFQKMFPNSIKDCAVGFIDRKSVV